MLKQSWQTPLRMKFSIPQISDKLATSTLVPDLLDGMPLNPGPTNSNSVSVTNKSKPSQLKSKNWQT